MYKSSDTESKKNWPVNSLVGKPVCATDPNSVVEAFASFVPVTALLAILAVGILPEVIKAAL